MKKTIGVFAHVDAGKTTFSEQVLFHAHAIRTRGRVDHQSAFLDAHPLERSRGITIFSDQATFELGGDTYYWVDTPGHVDFSTEMERAVSAIDFAVLIVSAVEGVQSHTVSVWRLLARYGVPVLLFINKLDRAGADLHATLLALRDRLSPDILDVGSHFSDGIIGEELAEPLAERDDRLLARYVSAGFEPRAWLDGLIGLIAARRVFPLFSGSALRDESVAQFMAALCALTRTDYAQKLDLPFSARVVKVRRDPQGARLAFLKVLQGRLRPRDPVAQIDGEEKVAEIRIYHGPRYSLADKSEAGDLCAVTGLAGPKPGDRVGAGAAHGRFSVQPMLTAAVLRPESVHPTALLAALRQLEEEDPALGVEWDERSNSAQVHVMGGIQLEVLRQLAQDRFGMDLQFAPPKVRYMETILGPAVGIGHFEPLRHYAEVHLKLDPGEPGSGVTFDSACHVDTLALSWQHLIEKHVFERVHRGVLVGAPLTDVKVTLLTGRAHLKHTEGGDFREATYRAIRNALMHAESALLEPILRFRLRAPEEAMGRVMGDLSRMRAQCDPPAPLGGEFEIQGRAPFSRFQQYPAELAVVSHGRGSVSMEFDRYERCEDERAIVEAAHYNPLAGDSPDSVFCSKGAGFTVAWDRVRAFAHCAPD